MIILLLFAFLLLAFALVFIHRAYRFHHRTVNDVIPFLRRLAIEELESLLDPREEESLQQNLSAGQFAKAQLNRIHLFREKLRCADHNARVLQDWAEYELERTHVTHDEDARANANALLDECRDFRIAALWIKVQLNLWHFHLKLLPVRRVPFLSSLRKIDSFDLLDCYRQVAGKAISLAGFRGESYSLKFAGLL